MFSIAHNLSIDTLRRQKRKPHSLPQEVWEETRSGEASVELGVHNSLKHAQVKEALGELPAEQRMVIELAYFKGLTRREIAEVTGVPLGTVHTRARLGLDKLRVALRDKGFQGA